MARDKVYSADIVIAGAGTAGSAAAVAAADQGLRVLLVEQSGAAGGSGSIGLVTPMMTTRMPGNPSCSYVAEEINRRMTALGAARADGFQFDPTMLPFVLEAMLMERGVKVLFHTALTGATMEGGRVTAVEAFNKSGRARIEGRVLIDATGDADLVSLAGLPLMHGDEATGKNQPVSLRYVVGGVDGAAFRSFLNEQGDAQSGDALYGAVTTAPGRVWPLSGLFEKAIAAGDLAPDDAVYWQFFGLPGRGDSIAFNCPEFFDLHDADDAENLSWVQLHGKQAILRQLLFYRKYLPGFERAYVSAVASMVGVRESRRAVTDYVVTAEDLLARRKFDDAIAQSNYPVDVHGRRLNHPENAAAPDKDPWFEVPLRALVVKDAENLLVAGRSLGAEFIAQSAIRIIPTCRALGEAAAIAAARACRTGSLHSVDGRAVREEMIRRGAVFAAR